MTSRDRSILEKRYKLLQDQIHAEHKKPKAMRDQSLIDTNRRLSATVKSWLNESDPAIEVIAANVKSVMSRNEFLGRIKEAIGVGDTDTIATIDTIEALREIWPKIKNKAFAGTLQISAPPIVVGEIKRLMSGYRLKKINGFR